MPYFEFFWTADIIAHIAEHDISPQDFEKVVMQPANVIQSKSSRNPAAFGYTQDGRYIIAVYEHLDQITIIPKTAYEVPEPR